MIIPTYTHEQIADFMNEAVEATKQTAIHCRVLEDRIRFDRDRCAAAEARILLTIDELKRTEAEYKEQLARLEAAGLLALELSPSASRSQ